MIDCKVRPLRQRARRTTLALLAGRLRQRCWRTALQINFDDWMFLLDDQVMLNRAVMSKFGIRLGEVLLSFRRLPP